MQFPKRGKDCNIRRAWAKVADLDEIRCDHHPPKNTQDIRDCTSPTSEASKSRTWAYMYPRVTSSTRRLLEGKASRCDIRYQSHLSDGGEFKIQRA